MINKEFIKYILFAVLSTLLNYFIQLSTEYFAGLLPAGFFYIPVYKSITIITVTKMGLATAGAFIFKYIADKYIVFKICDNKSVTEHFTMFSIYAAISILTTFFNWGTQILFKLVFNLEYLGLGLGLATGYTIKYLLDRKFVFCKEDEEILLEAE